MIYAWIMGLIALFIATIYWIVISIAGSYINENRVGIFQWSKNKLNSIKKWIKNRPE